MGIPILNLDKMKENESITIDDYINNDGHKVKEEVTEYGEIGKAYKEFIDSKKEIEKFRLKIDDLQRVCQKLDKFCVDNTEIDKEYIHCFLEIIKNISNIVFIPTDMIREAKDLISDHKDKEDNLNSMKIKHSLN